MLALRQSKSTGHIKRVSRGTLKNFEKKNTIKSKMQREPQLLEKKPADWTNAVSFPAKCQAVIPHVKCPSILNFDSEQSKVGDESNKKHVAKFIGQKRK